MILILLEVLELFKYPTNMVDILRLSLQNLGFTVTVQLITKLIYFLSNALLVRLVDSTAISIIHSRLLLLETIHFLISRDAIRKSCLQDVRNHDWRKAVNFIWTTVPIAILSSFPLGLIFWYWLEPLPELYTNQYLFGIVMISISNVFELLAEVPNVLAKIYFFNKLKSIMTVIYAFSRTLIFLSILLLDPSYSIIAFSIAQILSGIIWIIGYYIYFFNYLPPPVEDREDLPNFDFNSVKDFFPSFRNYQIPYDTFKLACTLLGTVLMKYVLHEGEKMLMGFSGLLSIENQAIIDIVQTMSSLPVQIFLKPLEEPLYFFYTQNFSRGNSQANKNKNHKEATIVIQTALNTAVFFGSIIASYFFIFAEDSLRFYVGVDTFPAKETSYLLYTQGALFLLMSILIIVENLSLAVMKEKEILWYNIILFILRVGSFFLIYKFKNHFIDAGFIFTSCLVTGSRALYSYYFMNKYYGNSKNKPSILSNTILSSLIYTSIFTIIGSLYKIYFKYDEGINVLVGLTSLTVTIGIYIWRHQELINMKKFILEHIKQN